MLPVAVTCALGIQVPLPAAAPLPPTTGTGLSHYDPYGAAYHATSTHFALRWGSGVSPTAAQQQAVLEQLEAAWSAGVDELGLPSPPGSASAYVNVYLGNSDPDLPPIGFVGGYVVPDLSNVPFMVLAPELLDAVGGYEDVLEGIVTHEFFHVLQFGTGSFSGGAGPFAGTHQIWWWESTATWFAHDTLPGNVWVPSAPAAYLLTPSLAVDHDDPTADPLVAGRRYHAALFVRHLTEHVTTAELVAESWADPRTNADPLSVVDELLVARGTSLEEVFPTFATHNAALDYAAADDYLAWASAWSTTYGEPYPAVLDTYTPGAPLTVSASGDQAPQSWGYQTIELDGVPASGGWAVTLTGEPGTLGTPTALHVAWARSSAGGDVVHEVLDGPVDAGSYELLAAADTERAWLVVTAQASAASPDERFGFEVVVAERAPPDSGTTGDTATDTGDPRTTAVTADTGAGAGATSDTGVLDTGSPFVTAPTSDTALATSEPSSTRDSSASATAQHVPDDARRCGCSASSSPQGGLFLLVLTTVACSRRQRLV